MSDDGYRTAAAGWVVHLRSGGTTPWPEWTRDLGRPAVAPSSGELPGAAQLELLRRLNSLGPQPTRVDHVLHRSATGRGAVELRLPWPPTRPAVDRELLRVANGVLADLVAELPDPARPSVRRRRTVPGLRRGPLWLLEGPPDTADGLRADLATVGRPAWTGRRWRPWGREPDLVLVVVPALAEGLHEVWTHRAEHGPVGTWLRFLAGCVERARLPPSLEVGAVAQRWAARIGPEAVHVVTAPAVADTVEELLGGRPDGDPGGVDVLPPSHAELLRRVGKVLQFVVPPAELARRRASFVAQLREDAAAWDPSLGPRRLALPPEVEPWLAAAARRVVTEVEAVGCRVHGDLGGLLLDQTAAPVAGSDRALRVRHDHLVTAAVRMIHRVGRVVDGTVGDGAVVDGAAVDGAVGRQG